MAEYENDSLTEIVIGCAYTVANTLGVGFLEAVYERALVHEIRKQGLQVESQVPINVDYDGVVVGNYTADILVEKRLIVELKVAKAINDAHLAQCLNYLKATRLKTCLLLNFGTPRIGVKRVSL